MNPKYVLGINFGSSSSGKVLHDGAACLVDRNGVVGALAEERVVRTKRAGGYKGAVDWLCDSFGVNKNQLQCVVVSSCCEPERRVDCVTEFPGIRVLSCNHHVSHALSVFCTSPFERAITLVLDAGGNTLQPLTTTMWWDVEREQQTYFLCDATGVQKIGEDFQCAYATGFGEVFRAFAYFLGWHSSRHAGNLMALSAHGNHRALGGVQLFPMDDSGRLLSPTYNGPKDPIEMAKRILDSCGISGLEPRSPGEPIQKLHKDVAAWVQKGFEQALCNVVDRVIRETGISDVCLAGGVAYNCKGIGALREMTRARRIHVGPASGDQGQSLGNAVYGLWVLNKEIPRFSNFSPYLGPDHRIYSRKTVELVNPSGNSAIVVHPKNVVRFVSKFLVMGCIVGWYQGRSEFGPRALGNRSILATPSLKGLSDKLNDLKGREPFMPFAPSVLAGEVERYFVKSVDVPFMSEVLFVREEERAKIVGALNTDGSARVHTVKKDANEVFFNLITSFWRFTGVPMLLNTSFNGAGEPIVETIEDAFTCFQDLDLDCLVIGDVVIMNRDLEKLGKDKISLSIGKEELGDATILDVLLKCRELMEDWSFVPRDRFLLREDFVRWIQEGKKCTTIRYRKGAMEYPLVVDMPLYITENFSRIPRGNQEGVLRISGLRIKAFGDLNDSDAQRDGFVSIGELRRVLGEIYGEIGRSEPVSIYNVDLL